MRTESTPRGLLVLVLAFLLGATSFARATQLLVYEQLASSASGARLLDATDASGAVNPRATLGGLVGIDFDAGGNLFGLGGGNNPLLYGINPASGATSPIGTGIGLNAIFEGDIAFDPTTGTLYGLYQLATPDMNLFSVDTSTGLATVVGAFSASFRNPAGMAFDAAGNLWVLNTQPGSSSLIHLNRATGAVISDVGLIESGNPFDFSTGPAGMDYDPVSGSMFVAAGGLLWTVDTSSGVLTALLGGSSFVPIVTGLAVVPGNATVPEPVTLWLLALGLMGLAAGRWRAPRLARARP